jgi:type II secretory pathway pseudopilin PulG
MAADIAPVSGRLRSDEGFGMIELIISLAVLNVALFAVFAGFQSSVLALARASQTATASVLADKQMELYRGQMYANLALHAAAVTTAQGDSTYTGDSAYNATQVTKTCTGSPLPAQCDPRQTVTGPDDRSYRVDSYIVTETPPSGRSVKRVTVVVRKSGTSTALARVTSTFDASTG